MQRSLHEQCGECAEHPSLEELSALVGELNPAFYMLVRSIENFEKYHAPMFDSLPFSTDPKFTHPGSTHPRMQEWRKKSGG